MIGNESFVRLLAGGDRRSTGASSRVVAAVNATPARFEELWACLKHANPLVRMRAADALEKFTRVGAASLQPHKAELLADTLDDGTAEVRWHLVALRARLQLSEAEAIDLIARLRHHMESDRSRIVRVMALQAAVDLARQHSALAAEAREMLKIAATSELASLRARARKLATLV